MMINAIPTRATNVMRRDTGLYNQRLTVDTEMKQDALYNRDHHDEYGFRNHLHNMNTYRSADNDDSTGHKAVEVHGPYWQTFLNDTFVAESH